MQSVRQAILQSIPASKVWCSDDFADGVVELPKRVALAKKHLQINPHHAKSWMSFDIDRAGGAFAFDELLLEPTLTVINPINKHAHHHIKLNKPVFMADAKAIAYYNDVRKALAFVLRADLSYSGFITKNPLSHHHHTLNSLESHAIAHDLHDLVDVLPTKLSDLVKEADAIKQKQVESGVGRNCYLFDELRAWAYSNVRKFRDTPAAWIAAVEAHAMMANNALTRPLSENEVKGIVHSVARYVAPNNKMDEKYAKDFRERQKFRIQQRWGDNECKISSAKIMNAQGKSTRFIASELGVNHSTVARWLRS